MPLHPKINIFALPFPDTLAHTAATLLLPHVTKVFSEDDPLTLRLEAITALEKPIDDKASKPLRELVDFIQSKTDFTTRFYPTHSCSNISLGDIKPKAKEHKVDYMGYSRRYDKPSAMLDIQQFCIGLANYMTLLTAISDHDFTQDITELRTLTAALGIHIERSSIPSDAYLAPAAFVISESDVEKLFNPALYPVNNSAVKVYGSPPTLLDLSRTL